MQESIFTLGGGGGLKWSGGGVQGPLRQTLQECRGLLISGTAITSGTFRDSDGTTKNVTTLT